MWKILGRFAAFGFLGTGLLCGEPSALQDAWSLADEARRLARSNPSGGEEALALYLRAMELAPDAPEIRRDYATVLAWQGRHVEAAREFAAVRVRQPEQPLWVAREMANAAFFGGDEEAALEAFDRLIAAGETDDPTLTRRGLTLLRLGRSAEAEAQYRQALGWRPESEAAAVGLGRAMAAQGRRDDAYSLAVTWGAEAPADSDIRAFAAEMLFEMGRVRESAEGFAQVAPARLEAAGLTRMAAEARRRSEGPPARQALSPPLGTGGLDAATLREQGVEMARSGDALGSLAYLEQSLRLSPENIGTIRDYAVVLGWAERYGDALEQFRTLLAREPEQPPWARGELARNQLFGGQPESARETLEGLLAQGHEDLPTLARLGLAQRWSGRSKEATATYRRVAKLYPESPEGARGLVQALADRNRLADALDVAEQAAGTFPDDAELRLRQAQVLNWAGRHVKAREVLAMLPQAFQDSRDGLQHRTLAARWASRPREAFELAQAYRLAHPDDPQASRLLRDLSVEYGSSVEVSAEGVNDSAGYSYRSALQQVAVPLTVSHRLRFLRERRGYEDEFAEPHEMTWTRYGAGWTGVLGRRVTADASVSSLDYSLDGAGRRLLGDASVSSLLTDQVTVAAGFGVVPAETLPALGQRLTARSAWAAARLRPTIKTEAGARYVRRDFEGEAVRQTLEYSGFYRVSQRGGHKIRVGGRSQWMWHDRQTPLFWSPGFFHTQLASVHVEGRLPANVDYVAEAGSGVQREAGYGRQMPLVATVEVAKRINPHVWLRFKAGYSNSSIDRINSGAGGGYRFRYFNVGLDFRPGRKGA